MAPQAAYDPIADWYEREFLPRGDGPGDPLGVDGALADLLGPAPATGPATGPAPATGTASPAPATGPAPPTAPICLELGCGTGARAGRIASLGWTVAGVDVSAGMLRHARGRLPVLLGDAARLPLRDNCVAAVATVMAHTDMPAYPAVLREAARVLRPGGVLVHVGVHPCFCGGFADRSDPAAVVIRPGYVDGHWTRASWTDQGVRDKVGASHFPLPELLGAFVGAGLNLERFAEGGQPVPVVLAVRARKP